MYHMHSPNNKDKINKDSILLVLDKTVGQLAFLWHQQYLIKNVYFRTHDFALKEKLFEWAQCKLDIK